MRKIQQPKPLPRKKYFRLEWREDQNGNHGWILHNMPMFDVGSGMTVAHDLLEHFEHKTDDMSSEYMAFGCIVWGRLGNYWGSFVSDQTPRERTTQIGEELAMFYRDLYRADTLASPPEWTRGPIDPELAESLDEIGAALYPMLVSEMEGERDSDSDETDEEFEERMQDTAARIMGWVYAGWITAELTWGRITTPFYFSNLFYNIEQAIDNEFKHGEEGEALSITVDYANMTARMRSGYINEITGRIDYRYSRDAITV